MEAMEVDSPVALQGGGSGQLDVVAAEAVDRAEDANPLHVISDSGSSTEVDEDENDEGEAAARAPLRLPATWAFSQRAVDRDTATPSAAHGTQIRRRLRYPYLHREGLINA